MPGGHRRNGCSTRSAFDCVIPAEGAATSRTGRVHPPERLSHPLLPPIEILASATAELQGLEVVSVCLHTHRQPNALVIALRHRGGGDVNLDDCAAFSQEIGEALEREELLPGAYVLEITSPGLDDDLEDDRDFRSFRGFPVRVRCREGELETEREGSLLGRDDSVVEINQRGKILRIPRDTVIEVRLITPEG
jgi:ribosome maturation factor RimP